MAGKTQKPVDEPVADEPAVPAGPEVADDGSISLADFEAMTQVQREDFAWTRGRPYGGATVVGDRVYL